MGRRRSSRAELSGSGAPDAKTSPSTSDCRSAPPSSCDSGPITAIQPLAAPSTTKRTVSAAHSGVAKPKRRLPAAIASMESDSTARGPILSLTMPHAKLVSMRPDMTAVGSSPAM
eukprot:scaffold2820_cov64-Phaeocystis_antarctica.AAC.2